MKTIEEQIKVMQHFANGGKIEASYVTDNTFWADSLSPVWNWDKFDYRIKEKKQTVTIEKWLIKKEDRYGYWTLEGDEDYFKTIDPIYKRVKLLDTYEVEI